MENQKISSFVLKVVAIILGVTLFKQFDFQTLQFEKPALAIVYIIIFAFAIYSIVQNAKKKGF